MEDLSKSLNKTEQIDAILLDFSKAFDKVPHKRLLTKLHHYGIGGKTNDLISHFLTDRTQTVVVNGENSATVKPGNFGPFPFIFTCHFNSLGYIKHFVIGIEGVWYCVYDDKILLAYST